MSRAVHTCSYQCQHPECIRAQRDELIDAKQRAEAEMASALALLARMRAACGDDGKRMQDELIEHLRQMRADAKRWRKCKRMRKSWWLEAMAEAGRIGGRSLDEQIDEQPDAAIDEK